jgi:hypothetical protein
LGIHSTLEVRHPLLRQCLLGDGHRTRVLLEGVQQDD